MKSSQRSLSSFQIHLVLTAAIVTASFAVVIAAAMFAPLFSQLDRSDLDHRAMAGLADYVIQLHSSYWPVVALMIAASTLSGILLFRKMTSPLVRFVRVFESVNRSELPELGQLRAKDYLHAEAESLNRMLSAMRERTDADDRDLLSLEKELRSIAGHLPGSDSNRSVAAALETVASLRERLPRRV